MGLLNNRLAGYGAVQTAPCGVGDPSGYRYPNESPPCRIAAWTSPRSAEIVQQPPSE
jgi:hypothetical protein